MPLQHNIRALLLSLGVSDWNSTMIIPYTFTTPSTTDPGMAQIIILVRHLQRNLNRLGAGNVEITGRLDKATGDAISQISGTEWLSLPWYQIMQDVVAFKRSGQTLSAPMDVVAPTGISGIELPDVPGGMITYGLGAFALWYFLVKKKRAAR